jgi:CBS domain-containing protein
MARPGGGTVKTLPNPYAAPRLILAAYRAEDLMTPNPMSISRQTPVRDAAAFLSGRGISAAPVIDAAGRPVGVVNSTDILPRCQSTSAIGAPVSAVMTPVVFCVRTDATAEEVVDKLTGLSLRRLFVVDADGVVVGVIAATDVLRRLRRRGRRLAGDDGGRAAERPSAKGEYQWN